MRYALYFTPGRDDPLTRMAAAWLGRDAFSGSAVPANGATQLPADAVQAWTAEPRRYGFHATLVAPFVLKQGLGRDDVIAAAESLAGRCAPFDIPRLQVSRLGDFLALTPAERSAEADALASEAVDHFGALRAPLTTREIERRNPERLSARQRENLERYGYPYVKDEFRFHMTLTGRVTAAEAVVLEPVLADLFSPLLSPVRVDTVSLFLEPEAGAPFTVLSTHELGGAIARRE